MAGLERAAKAGDCSVSSMTLRIISGAAQCLWERRSSENE